MPNSSNAAPSIAYAEFQAELDQILRHKWLMSEQADEDIGFEKALNDWAQNHRAEWRRERNRKVGKAKG